jgi:hypothetical protein
VEAVGVVVAVQRPQERSPFQQLHGRMVAPSVYTEALLNGRWTALG